MTHIDLFSGIGGFALAARWAGIKTVQFVEIDKFCQKVLQKNFPEVPIHDDIKQFNGSEFTNVFLLTGGFPCQPFSCAGKRRGKEDDRYLWPEMLRVISESKPRWIVGENVAGFIDMGLDDCISDLERTGYEVQAFIIPACAVNAPHRRDRVWICAHSVNGEYGTIRGQIGETDGLQGVNRPSLCTGWIERTNSHAPDTTDTGIEGLRQERENSVFQNSATSDTQSEQTHPTEQRGLHPESCGKDSINRNTESTRQSRRPYRPWEVQYGRTGSGSNWLEVATRLCRVDDGLPRKLDRVNRLKALGNAIVPQVAYEIMKSIVEVG